MTPDVAILKALRGAERHLAVPELAESVGIASEALRERIAVLNQAGYQIELVPHLGYRLRGGPDRVIADDLLARWGDEVCYLGKKILVFEETASTNDVVHRLGQSGAPEGLIVFAERQTAGRGRLGRVWESSAHLGLWFSLLVRPSKSALVGREAGDWSRLTTWTAVAIARSLEKVAPECRVEIKWPNDIYLNGKKGVGILIESCLEPSGGFAVVGIGVNVNHLEFPEALREKATSLRLASGREAFDRMEVAAMIVRELDQLYPRLGEDFSSVVAEAERRSLLVGKWVEVRIGIETMKGKVEGLEPDGMLRLRDEQGERQILSGGEVSIAHW